MPVKGMNAAYSLCRSLNVSSVTYMGWNCASPVPTAGPKGTNPRRRYSPNCRVVPETIAGICTLLDSVLPKQRQDTLEHLRSSKLLFNCQRDPANFCHSGAGRNPIGKPGVQRKRPISPDRQHCHQLIPAQGNQISILFMKLIHQPLRWRTLVLRNLFYKGSVVQPDGSVQIPNLHSQF